jgi:hypothetical protein
MLKMIFNKVLIYSHGRFSRIQPWHHFTCFEIVNHLMAMRPTDFNQKVPGDPGI